MPHRLSCRRAVLSAVLIGGLAAAAGPPSAGAAAGPRTWNVSASATSDPACSAASASHPFATVAAALACSHSGDTIKIGAGTFAGAFTVPDSVSVIGAGAGKTTIANASQIGGPEFTIAPGLTVSVSGLTVNGDQVNGGILATSDELSLQKIAVVNTVELSASDPAAVAVIPGTAGATVTVDDSTVSANTGYDAGGIAVAATGATAPEATLAIADSTISGNTGQADAGGVYLYATSGTLVNDTIADNAGNEEGGLIVSRFSSATVANSILAANTGQEDANGPDCGLAFAGTLDDGGHNLIGVAAPGAADDCGFQNGVNGDVAGTAAAPVDPHLGAVAANGGTTPTQALLPGSPAIAAGSVPECNAAPTSGLDERGVSRATATRLSCDIGAYDTAGKGRTWYVSHTATKDPACSAASQADPFATLGGALECAQSGDTIKLGAGSFAGNVAVDSNVVLVGAGATKTTISNASPIDGPELTIAPGVSATVRALAVDGAGQNGGILAGTGQLVLRDVAVQNTYALSYSAPAAVAVVPASGNATLTALDSTFANNYGAGAGGVELLSTVAAPSTGTIANSTFTGDVGGQDSGGVYLDSADAVLRDDTLTGNSGGVTGGLLAGDDAQATVADTLSAGNASQAGNEPDCLVAFNGTVSDGGHNLLGVAAPGAAHDCGIANGAGGDLTGTASAPLDPQVGPLADNGGSIETEALLAGSPAIGAGNPADCLAAPVSGSDERGFARNATARGACDIGAYDTGGASS